MKFAQASFACAQCEKTVPTAYAMVGGHFGPVVPENWWIGGTSLSRLVVCSRECAEAWAKKRGAFAEFVNPRG